MDPNMSRPPDYSLPPYDDEDLHHTPTGYSPAAVRLLTSEEHYDPQPQTYVQPSSPSQNHNQIQTPSTRPISPISPASASPSKSTPSPLMPPVDVPPPLFTSPSNLSMSSEAGERAHRPEPDRQDETQMTVHNEEQEQPSPNPPSYSRSVA